MEELLKKDNEIKHKKQGKKYGDKERVHYEESHNLFRETLQIDAKADNIFQKERNAFMENFDDFLNNLDLNNDSQVIQEKVGDYIDQFKILNKHKNDKLKNLHDKKTKIASSDSEEEPYKQEQEIDDDASDYQISMYLVVKCSNLLFPNLLQ